MNNGTTKTSKYDSFGDYCCDTVMITSPGSGEYDVIPPNAAVRPGLSELFEKAGYFVYRQLVDVHKMPPEDASILIINFENGDCGTHLPTSMWKGMEMMMGQTVGMPLRAPFEKLLELPIGSFRPLKNTLVMTANKINRNYVKDKGGSLNLCKWVLRDKNIVDFPIPKSHDRSQSANPGGSGCVLPFVFLILTCTSCIVISISFSVSWIK